MNININLITKDRLYCGATIEISQEDFMAHRFPLFIERALYDPVPWKFTETDIQPTNQTRRYELVERGHALWYREV